MSFSLRRIAAGIGANALNQIIVAGTQLSLVPIMSAKWGLTLYGVWLILSSIPRFLGMSDLGFATAAGTKMTMLAARNERAEAGRVFQSASVMIAISSAVAVVVAVAVICLVPDRMLPTTRDFTELEGRFTLVALILYAIVSVQGSLIMAGFRANGQYHKGVNLLSGTILAENCFLFAVIILGGDPLAAALSLLGARICGSTIQYLIFCRSVSWLRLGFAQAHKNEVRALAWPAIALMSFPLGQAALIQGSALALGAAAGAAAVPAFVATRTLSRIGVLGAQMTTNAVTPELSAMAGKGDQPAQGALVILTLAAAMLVALPFALLLLLFGEDIVSIWTNGVIVPSGYLLSFICLSVILSAAWNPLASMAIALNKQTSYSLAFIGCSMGAIALTYVLALEYREVGAAAAVAIADAVILFIILRRFRGLFGPAGSLAGSAQTLKDRIHATLRRRGNR